jgi:hypothetical protein
MAKQAAAHSIRVPLQIRTPKDREKIESTVESLIAILDEEDGDCDLEPSLCGGPCTDDREADTADDEPELGWTGDINQERAQRGLILAGDFNHSESEHDGREPSLGWTVDGIHGGSDDREADYVAYAADGIGHGLTADMEPDTEADREPRLPHFVFIQPFVPWPVPLAGLFFCAISTRTPEGPVNEGCVMLRAKPRGI